MNQTAPFLTVINESGASLPRLALALLKKAIAPSMRAFAWASTEAPIGSPLRPFVSPVALYFHQDRSGFELTIGQRRYGFGIDRKENAWR